MTFLRHDVVVAVPARDEAASIASCLAAIDAAAIRVPRATVSVLLLANNCADATADAARAFRPRRARLRVVERDLGAADAHSGGARRAALDLAAASLPGGGVLMTTDADSRVASDWIAANLSEIEAGADAVAGVVAFDAATRASLPPLPARALEWRLAALHARLGDLLDRQAHNPWPSHIWAWGASLALTVSAYERVGGLPNVPLAEDRALAAAIERHDLRLRRSHRPVVYTSARRTGRAPGGFADLLRRYEADPETPCDAALEPTARLVRRLRARARLRAAHPAQGFGARWEAVEQCSPTLTRTRIGPRQLAREVSRAERLIVLLERREAHQAGSPLSVAA